MYNYPVHTIESAPAKSQPALRGLQESFGLIPNLAATMATSPTLISGFVTAFGNFHGGSFSGAEKQALLLTNAVANRSAWAVAFHSTLALKEGITAPDVEAIRQRRTPADVRLAALVQFDRALIETRGALSPVELEAFRAAGFSDAHALEVIAGLAVSVMANYAGNITHPPLEAAFRAQAWQG
jgi:alkylhydroperoxidase family enzyme